MNLKPISFPEHKKILETFMNIWEPRMKEEKVGIP